MINIDHVVVNGSTMDIHVALPDGVEPRPAVLIMHHRYGIEEFAYRILNMFADAGFVAIVPNLFYRSPADQDIDIKRDAIRDEGTIADIVASIDHVKTISRVRDDSLAILGHCMGGRMAFLGASISPAFRAAVVLYSGNVMRPFGEGIPSPFERLKDIQCPVLGLFGNDDLNPSADEVDRIDAELTRCGIAHEFHRYDGAGHGFAHSTIAELYREEQALDANAKTIAFLRANLNAEA